MVTLAFMVSVGAVSATDNTCEVGLKITYEYPDDNINPTIESLTDNNGQEVEFQTYFDPAANMTKITFQHPQPETGYNLTIKAPGYQTTTTQFTPTQHQQKYYAHLQIQLNATQTYKIGREVTKKADQILNFTKTRQVLVITTAGSVYYENSTTEDVLEGILNQANGIISYGKGNLLLLRKTRIDPLDFAFITKKGNDLILAYFKNASLTPTYIGTVSQNMTKTQWNNLTQKLGDDAFPIASLANAWALGLPADILREAAFHGHVCLGTISGYAMIETLLKYYPPSTGTGGAEASAYIVIGVPGGSDDDVFVYAMDATPGKRSYIGYNTTDDSNMVGFIRWNSNTKTGTLIIMTYNWTELAEQFRKESGTTIEEDTVTELKFNAWAVQKLITNPESLVKILYAFDNLTEEQVNYLAGGVGSTTVQDAHGLDMEYILTQNNLVNATPDNKTYTKGNLDYNQLKEIGIEATNLAKELFQQAGIQLEKDSLDILVLTSAGYVRLNGQDTSPVWDGIYEMLGSRISRKTLLPVHSALWSQLWFTFIIKGGNYTPDIIGKSGGFGKFSFNITEEDEILYAIQLVYDPIKGFIISNDTKGPVYDIGAGWNYTNPTVSKVFKNWNSIVTIANAWSYDPPFDMLMVYLFHNHVCPGVSPSYLIADYIYKNYPLGENEKYIYVTTTDYCKDDGLLLLLGISPGQGTYYNQRLLNTQSSSVQGGQMEGILIIWDEKLNIGKAVIITYKGPSFQSGANALRGYIDLYKGKEPAGLRSLHIVTNEAPVKYITRDDMNMILSGAAGSPSSNAIQYIMGLPDRQLSDLIPTIPSVPGIPGTPGTPGVPGVPGIPGTPGVPGVSSGSGVSPGFVGSFVGAVSGSGGVAAASPGHGGKQGRAYEVTRASSGGSHGGGWYIYGVIGGLVLIGLAAFGFLRGGFKT
ncbi:MAG: FmdE family protein [Methanothermobacter tenebrarum]